MWLAEAAQESKFRVANGEAGSGGDDHEFESLAWSNIFFDLAVGAVAIEAGIAAGIVDDVFVAGEFDECAVAGANVDLLFLSFSPKYNRSICF